MGDRAVPAHPPAWWLLEVCCQRWRWEGCPLGSPFLPLREWGLGGRALLGTDSSSCHFPEPLLSSRCGILGPLCSPGSLCRGRVTQR